MSTLLFFDSSDNQFKTHALRVDFIDFNEKRVKYDNTERYWSEFVTRWWHAHSLTFTPVKLTVEQQGRLDQVNSFGETTDRWLYEFSRYVKDNAIDPNTTCPHLTGEVTTVRSENFLEGLRDHKRQQLADYRYQQEVAGTTLGDGTPVNTGRIDQNMTSNAYNSLKNGLTTSVDFKGANGWVSVDLATLEPIAQAMNDHVQTCFSAERDVDESHIQTATDEETIGSLDVRGLFDTSLSTLQGA